MNKPPNIGIRLAPVPNSWNTSLNGELIRWDDLNHSGVIRGSLEVLFACNIIRIYNHGSYCFLRFSSAVN